MKTKPINTIITMTFEQIYNLLPKTICDDSGSTFNIKVEIELVNNEAIGMIGYYSNDDYGENWICNCPIEDYDCIESCICNILSTMKEKKYKICLDFDEYFNLVKKKENDAK